MLFSYFWLAGLFSRSYIVGRAEDGPSPGQRDLQTLRPWVISFGNVKRRVDNEKLEIIESLETWKHTFKFGNKRKLESDRFLRKHGTQPLLKSAAAMRWKQRFACCDLILFIKSSCIQNYFKTKCVCSALHKNV